MEPVVGRTGQVKRQVVVLPIRAADQNQAPVRSGKSSRLSTQEGFDLLGMFRATGPSTGFLSPLQLRTPVERREQRRVPRGDRRREKRKKGPADRRPTPSKPHLAFSG